MGTIKVEFDPGEFKSELVINIVIRKDGEVVEVEKTTSTSQPLDNKVDIVSTVDKKAISAEEIPVNVPPGRKRRGGNMMGVEL